MRNNVPHFTINNRFQKSKVLYFQDIITPEVMQEISKKLTGEEEYTYEFIDEVNYGRLAILEYGELINYISFSVTDYVKGRNYALQSVPTAITKFYFEKKRNKNMFYYFLPSIGNYETGYLFFMYRILLTAGVNFINGDKSLSKELTPFNSVEDIIFSRKGMKKKQNNSSYMTIDPNGNVQIFAKTYGSNKKESTLLCLAVANITKAKIKVYELIEQNLKQLPKPDVEVMKSLGVEVIRVDRELEEKEYEKENSLRSPKFIYNLLVIRGRKSCAMCGCNIPQLIEGAHIWPVSEIKKDTTITDAEKIDCAIDGHNGIWLCRNHHKLFDSDILTIEESKKVKINHRNDQKSIEYIVETTPNIDLVEFFDETVSTEYLEKRYSCV